MKALLICTMLILPALLSGNSSVEVFIPHGKVYSQEVFEPSGSHTGSTSLNEGIPVSKKVYSVKSEESFFENLTKKHDQLFGFYQERQNILNSLVENPLNILNLDVAQPRTATGTVTDQYGQPLVGVTVMVKGTSIGAITDLNGNFSLSIPSGAEIIQFSFVGMRTMELFIEGRTVFNIEMEEDRIGIDEVIAIGYGTMRKSDLTGSVSSIKGDDLQTGAVNSLDKQLSGRISGVQVTQNSGQPGSGTTIRIRGTNSIIGNNEPLFVVDGVPYGYSIDAGVNPNDIESVEILKDASATAIYGSRGANGVVLITTKSGSQGETKVTFDSYYSLSSITKKLDLLNGEEIAEVHRMAIQQGVAQAYDPDAIQGAGTDWQDEMYRTAASKNYQMTVAGGSQNLSFYFSGNYMDEQGVILNSNFERYGLRANINSKVNERLNLGLNLYMSRSIQNPVNEGRAGGGVINSILVGNPIYPVKDESGQYTLFTDPTSQTGNPVAMALLETRENNTNTILANLFGEYTVFDGLVARASFGSNIWDNKNNFFAPAEVFTGLANNNQANINISNIFYWVSTNTLTYNKMINDNHNLEVMAATIMSANMLGVMSGEWQNVSKKAFFKLYSGIGILVFAIILVSLSNLYL